MRLAFCHFEGLRIGLLVAIAVTITETAARGAITARTTGAITAPPASAATTAAAVASGAESSAPATATRTAGGPAILVAFIHPKGSSAQLGAVHLLHRFLTRFAIGIGDKSKTAGTTGLTIQGPKKIGYFAKGLKPILNFFLAQGEADISYKQFKTHYSWYYSGSAEPAHQPLARGRLAPAWHVLKWKLHPVGAP